jgi:hypothetical protein
MSTQCTVAARVLGDVDCSFSTYLLPNSKLPNENVTANFESGGLIDSLEEDTILAPSSISAREVTLTAAGARVCTGPAVFHLAPIYSEPLQNCVLAALASGTEVIATLRIASIDEQVPVDIKAADALNCVLLTVSVSPGTPDGSLVIINNVCVAGCAVNLNELLPTVTIGFNHAPAPEGAVYAAAKANDLPGLNAALRSGGSTEEKTEVSAKALRGGVVGLRISAQLYKMDRLRNFMFVNSAGECSQSAC